VIDFFADLPPELSARVEALSRRSYELREGRREILLRHGADDEETLLRWIEAGEIEEHPARDDHLAALELARERDVVREELAALIARAGRGG
jgi:hypothetical protein